MNYQEFLATKALRAPDAGIEISESALPLKLSPFQSQIVKWSLKKGRAAIFADTGLGKTWMQLAWAEQVVKHTERPALIFAPLAVNEQTVMEGEKIGIAVRSIRNQSQADPGGINIINYEMLDHVDLASFGAVVLDESHILANFSGKIKQALVKAARPVPFKLTCTATPTPNETVELTNQGDFLGVMKPSDMLNIFFTTRIENKQGGKFALKPNATEDFYRFLASWAVTIKKPSDLGEGFSDEGYILPPLHLHKSLIASDYVPEGKLFHDKLNGVKEHALVRRSTMEARVAKAVELVRSEPGERWLVWTGLNDESKLAAKLIPGAVEVTGSHSPEYKAEKLLAFARGEIPVLVTKPEIAGAGLNFQTCARSVFVGLGYSYRDYYQCIRRIYRFGQAREVHAHIVLSDKEEEVYDIVLRKEAEARSWSSELIKHIQGNQLGQFKPKGDYAPLIELALPKWLRSVA